MAAIRKRNGKWQVQIRRQGFKSVSRSFHKRADAEEWARFKERQADRRELSPSPQEMARYRVRDILERYEREITPFKKSKTQEQAFIKLLLRQKLADLNLDVLNETHIAEYRDMRLKTIKPASFVREIAILQHALEIAMREWGLPLRHNPVKKIKKPRINNIRDRRLETGELERLIEGTTICRNSWIKPVILFAVHTGMRQSEILNLKWENIDLGKSTLEIPTSKNGHGRIIPLAPGATDILINLPRSRSGQVFNLNSNSFRLSWKRLIKRTGIKNLHFHDLRHEAISRFFEKGLSIPEVALISGHRDFKMLFRYTHLRPEDVAKKLA